jgi:outer membrane murein-binding lipoprotein Lpp
MSEDLTKKLPASADEKLTLILTTVQTLTVRVENLDSRLAQVEQKVDERLYDTRPIWQKVVGDIAHLQEGQEALRTEVRAMRRDIYYRFSILNDTLLAIQADDRDIHDRVSRLELSNHAPNSQT